MSEHTEYPSLLSYLDSAPFAVRLVVRRSGEDTEAARCARFPFPVVSDSDPLTRIVAARFETGSGSTVNDVLLLLQRDKYLLSGCGLPSINNKTIEQLWRKSHAYYSMTSESGSFMTLSGQADEEGGLVPFQPLLFCSEQRRFFNTPCPACGRVLDECRDDRILAHHGLPVHSKSLCRYLYCRSCFAAGNDMTFYALETGSLDTPAAKDFSALIKGFARLVENRGDDCGLPCADCSLGGECYGPRYPACSRIVPFSFYPFFMFVFDAMPVNAEDFLALVSGCPVELLEQELRQRGEGGRLENLELSKPELGAGTHFFFEAEDRFFLEVLFLKISFFQELMRSHLHESAYAGRPAPLCRTDQVWVKLTGRNSLMPALWCFEPRVVDIFRERPEVASRPGLHSHLSIHCLGLLWFQVLLANADRDGMQVPAALEKVWERSVCAGSPVSEGAPSFMTDDAFRPENIFWYPGKRTVDPRWHALWRRSLNLGWSLLRTGASGTAGWSKEAFLRELEDLRREVKADLFAGTGSPKAVDHSECDEAVSRILRRIAEKWSRQEELLGEDFIRETILISQPESDKGTCGAPADYLPRQARYPLQAASEQSVSTVVPTAPGPEEAEEPLPEKISDENLEEDDLLAETIVLTPGADSRKRAVEDDLLAETIVIAPGADSGKRKKRSDE